GVAPSCTSFSLMSVSRFRLSLTATAKKARAYHSRRGLTSRGASAGQSFSARERSKRVRERRRLDAPVERGERSRGDAVLGQNARPARFAPPGCCLGLIEVGHERRGELVGAGHLSCSRAREKLLDRFTEVRRVRAKEHRGPKGSRFHHVLSAPAGEQASSHK